MRKKVDKSDNMMTRLITIIHEAGRATRDHRVSVVSDSQDSIIRLSSNGEARAFIYEKSVSSCKMQGEEMFLFIVLR